MGGGGNRCLVFGRINILSETIGSTFSTSNEWWALVLIRELWMAVKISLDTHASKLIGLCILKIV